MTAPRAALALVALAIFAVPLVACALAEEGGDDADDATATDAILLDEQEGPASAYPESVQVLMQNGRDFCTGVLVSSTRVLTAAHCLVYDRTWTVWSVKAPFASGAPTREARLVGVLSHDFDDPAHGDVGVLELDEPITLAQYAVPTDIGAAADRGATFKGVAVGRAGESRDGALVRSRVLSIASAKGDGYATGLSTPYYSGGGDSGGGLFLVESGRLTHKLVGVERQPQPSRGVDYFTRVDGPLLALIAKPRDPSAAPPTGSPSTPAPAPTSTSTAQLLPSPAAPTR